MIPNMIISKCYIINFDVVYKTMYVPDWTEGVITSHVCGLESCFASSIELMSSNYMHTSITNYTVFGQ